MLVIRQRGDTIIEVLLAVTVFSLVAVGAVAIMNQGTNSAQRSLEITLVKEQIDSQAQALRTAQQDYLATASVQAPPGKAGQAWKTITQNGVGDATVSVQNNKCPSRFQDNFAMNGHTGEKYNLGNITSMNSTSAPPYAQVTYDPTDPTAATGVYGIWISKQVHANFSPKAYDFTIHACWYSSGSNVPMQLQTIVRLYE